MIHSKAPWAQLGSTFALATAALAVTACSSKPTGESVGAVQSAVLAAAATNAIAGSAIASLTLTGTGPYTCTVATNNSTSGGTCSVSNAGVVTYTAGNVAGYNIKGNRTSDYLKMVTSSGVPFVNTGAATAVAGELFVMAASGTGFTFKAKSSGYYMRFTSATGNSLIADTAVAGNADLFTIQDCTFAANRFGLKSVVGTSSYWQSGSVNVSAKDGGSGSACSPTNGGAWEAFYLYPGTDVLTVKDATMATVSVTVSVENPIQFSPSTLSLNTNGSISSGALRAWGGSMSFASCLVTANGSVGAGTCSVSAGGLVTYTAGSTPGTDTLKITDSQGHTGSISIPVTGPFVSTSAVSHATKSAAMTSVTVSGGTSPYSCAVTTSTSGGATCTMTGGVVSYTAGSTAGYYMKSGRTSDYLYLVSNVMSTGGALGSSADLWVKSSQTTGFRFKSKNTGFYLRNNGNVLYADSAASSTASLYTTTDCNGTGNAGFYDRFGFKSAGTTSSPYWQAKGTDVEAVANGNGSACNPTGGSPWEAFTLVPNTDVLTISDSAGHTTPVTVTVENTLSVWPSSTTVAINSAIPSTVHVWGGSSLFNGTSTCLVTTNQSGGGACTMLGSGFFSYTAGGATGTDTLTITDTEGHSVAFTVQVVSSLSTVLVATSQAATQIAPKANTGFAVAGGGTYTWALVTNNSGGTLNTATGAYTAGATGGVSDLVRVTDSSGNTGYVVVSVGSTVNITPKTAAVQPSGAKTFTAVGGTALGYTWSLSTNASGGSINSSTGVYTAGAAAGTDVISVTDSVGNTSTATVTVGCGADSSLRILYPYDSTVFPLGLLPPLVQWSDNGTATYAKVTLKYPATGTALFTWSEIVNENGALTTPYDKLPTALPVAGGGRAQIPDLVWRTFSTAAAGQDAQISVQVLESGKGTLASTVTVHFASEALKGSIYYQSYDSNLVGASPPNGATLKIKVGDAQPTVVDGNTVCRDCHSVSADGTRLVTQDGSSGPALYQTSVTVNLTTGAESTVAGSSNDGRFAWPALSPDGSMMFTNSGNTPGSLSGQWGGSVNSTPSALYSTSTGNALTTAGLPSGLLAMFPSFATDTSAIAFNYNNYDGKTLGLMSVTWNSPTANAWNFGTPVSLFVPPTAPATYPNGSGAAVWPSFMPAGQGGVVVQHQIHFDCQEMGADGSSSVNASNFEHNIGSLGELWWVNTSGTPIPTRLDKANGLGYLPTGKNGHGIAGTSIPTVSTDPTDTAGGTPSVAQLAAITNSACKTSLRNAISAGDDTRLNYKPMMNPSTTGGYQWMVFTSRRLYGNSISINPYASDPRYTSEISATKAAMAGYALQPSPKKLWVAAVKTTPTAGTDPSYPAFYLDGQELYSGNSRSFWVLPQCVPSSSTPAVANVCTTTADCCQTTPSTCTLDIPIATNPPLAHCVPTATIMCAADNASCNVDGDCCNLLASGTRCSNNKCTAPSGSGYPTSQGVTYDFQATCSADGTHPVWQLLQSQVIIPGDATISYTAASAPTQAGLAAASAGSMGTATMTVQPPQYVTGPKTVDQVLRALTPTSSSSAWLRVVATLNPTSDNTQSPKLTSLTPTFDCLFDE